MAYEQNRQKCLPRRNGILKEMEVEVDNKQISKMYSMSDKARKAKGILGWPCCTFKQGRQWPPHFIK